MIGMGSNPFFTGTEVSFNDCPLSDFSKGYSFEKINKVDLDRPLGKDMDAVQNFSNKLEQGRRELTTGEKQELKDTLGWGEKQITKCTIGDDGVIYYKTDRSDLEGKTAENGVPYERKRIELNGIQIEGVFPVFQSAVDVTLPLDKYQSRAYARECNTRLREVVQNNSELRNHFSREQLQQIENGQTPDGYVWHHNEKPGQMQLVKRADHDRCIGGAAHTGGNALWGPDSIDKSQKGEVF